jgi:hypothetical protein
MEGDSCDLFLDATPAFLGRKFGKPSKKIQGNGGLLTSFQTTAFENSVRKANLCKITFG